MILVAIGCAGLGFVWGWLLALWVARGGWWLEPTSWLLLIAAVALQGATIVWLGNPRALIPFGAALVAALGIHLFWVAALDRAVWTQPR